MSAQLWQDTHRYISDNPPRYTHAFLIALALSAINYYIALSELNQTREGLGLVEVKWS